MKQRKKIIKVDTAPSGLFYIPDFLSSREEVDLIQKMDSLNFSPYEHQSFIAKREIVRYGTTSGYNLKNAQSPEDMPEWLQLIQNKCLSLIQLNGEAVGLTLVTHYPEQAGIGWHRDATQFGSVVIGVSLASAATMRFRRFVDNVEELYRIKLAERSVYIISGPARFEWQHSIASVSKPRFSFTFRTKKFDRNSPEFSLQTPEVIESNLKWQGIQFIAHKLEDPKQLSLFE